MSNLNNLQGIIDDAKYLIKMYGNNSGLLFKTTYKLIISKAKQNENITIKEEKKNLIEFFKKQPMYQGQIYSIEFDK